MKRQRETPSGLRVRKTRGGRASKERPLSAARAACETKQSRGVPAAACASPSPLARQPVFTSLLRSDAWPAVCHGGDVASSARRKFRLAQVPPARQPSPSPPPPADVKVTRSPPPPSPSPPPPT
eukprot:1626494-Prymnesium_polylepis.1